MPRPKTIEEADRMLAAEIAAAKERHKDRLAFIEEPNSRATLIRETARELRTSVDRAGQIVERRHENLSVRSRNALRTLLNSDHFTPNDVAASVSERDLRQVPNCGKVSITDIKLWLHEHGLHLSASGLDE